MAEPTGLHSPGHTEPQAQAKPLPGIPRFAAQACASTFGGPNDPGTGNKGYKGDDLRGKMAFAELGMGTALGGLPYKSKVAIAYKGRYVVVEKLDIGLGGAPCGGHARKIDLWHEAAAAIGLSGTDVVSYSVGISDAEGKKLSEQYGPGGLNLEKGAGDAKEAIEGAIKGAFDWAKELGKILHFLGSSAGWLRIGKVIFGLILVVLAIGAIVKSEGVKIPNRPLPPKPEGSFYEAQGG